MRMLALGVDHRSAPTAVREALAFDGERLRRGLDALKVAFNGAGNQVTLTKRRTTAPDARGL